eukprot:3268584-Prymnesium_polylepis.1
MVYGPLAVPPATPAMDLAQRGSANSSPRSAKRVSMSRLTCALAAALGILLSDVREVGRPLRVQ